MPETKPRSVVEKLNLLPTVNQQVDISDEEEDFEDPDHYQAFVPVRQPNRRAEMLELVFKNGRRESFTYSHLYRAIYDPDIGIILYFSEHTVTIRGLRLLSGHRRLLIHRIASVYEADSCAQQLAEPDHPVIQSVSIADLLRIPNL